MEELGLFDSQDNCWLGDSNGVFKYTDKFIAKAVREIVTVQLGWDWSRVQVLPYPKDAKDKKDEVDTLMSPEEALRRIEEGEA